jgi:cytochrome b561
MRWRNSPVRYGPVSIGLHWLMLLLLAAVYAAMELRGIFPKGSDPREAMKAWHYMIGMSILVLALVRLVAHFSDPAPPIEPPPAGWQKLAAAVMHLALYALMIGMPLLGWILLSAEGKPIALFGMELPALVAKNDQLGKLTKELHETVGNIGYFLIGAHAAAALFHHYITRDNTLRRMLPHLAQR